MKPTLKAIAGAALAVSMMLAQTAAPTPTPGAQQPGQRLQRFRRQQLQRLATWLNLTPDQRQQIQEIRTQMRTEAQPVASQLKTGRQQLAGAMKAGKSDAIDGIATQQGVLEGQMTAIRTKALAKIYALLTPDQKQKADQFPGRLQLLVQGGFVRNNG